MKKLLYLSVAVVLALCVVFKVFKNMPHAETKNETVTTEENFDESLKDVKAEDELRAVWLTYYEISEMCVGKDEEYFKNASNKLLSALSSSKINTVFYQARAFADALYSSSVFPVSQYISKDGVIEYDPLEVFIECASEFEISVHAWVNPFRISYNNDISALPFSHPARILYEKNKSALIICEKGIYFDPSSTESTRLILDGIRELISRYEIKGLQFDDYFYPPCEFESDFKAFEEYREGGGTLSLADYRRENVSEFISAVYSAVKAQSLSLLFGISPSAKIRYNTETLYADVSRWCGEEGFVDYIMPQIYYGFNNENAPFERVAEEWRELVVCKGVKLYCGLALYKSGIADENAGSGKSEWQESADILKRQYLFLLKSGFSGYSLFSCKYFLPENENEFSYKEIKNLCDVLK